jgi:hypothetical protein
VKRRLFVGVERVLGYESLPGRVYVSVLSLSLSTSAYTYSYSAWMCWSYSSPQLSHMGREVWVLMLQPSVSLAVLLC